MAAVNLSGRILGLCGNEVNILTNIERTSTKSPRYIAEGSQIKCTSKVCKGLEKGCKEGEGENCCHCRS